MRSHETADVDPDNRHVLITGGAGFIGSHLVNYINAKKPNWTVTVVDDFSAGSQANLKGAKVELRRGTILSEPLLESVMPRADIVVHLAAIGSVPRSINSPGPTHEVNATGTLKVLESAREHGVESVIVASSSSVYGANSAIPKSENAWNQPMSPYAVSKLATEAYALAFFHSYAMNTLALRFFNVFGPRQAANGPYSAVVPRFVSAAIRGEPLVIFGDGGQFRDFTYVTSVAQALYSACEKNPAYSRPLNLAFGKGTTILHLAERILYLSGSKSSIEFRDPRVGEVRASEADASAFRKVFPDVSQTSLDDGLRATISWFKKFGHGP